jgi:Domain of unknown function (DUF4844)
MSKEQIILELEQLISKNSFSSEVLHSTEIWQHNPELIDYIYSKMNSCTNELLKAVYNNASPAKLKKILRKHLYSFRRIDYDTEDAEFITECFELLAHIIGVRFGSTLTRWLYGYVIWTLVALSKVFRKQKIISQKTTNCTSCQSAFTIQVTQTGSDRESDWIVGKCAKCNEFSLWETIANARRTNYETFIPVEYLSKKDYTEEQANIRLEQLKYWRK